MKKQLYLWAALMYLLTVFQVSAQNPQPGPDYISGPYTPATLKEALLSRAAWKPFPTAAEPEAWQALPEALRNWQIAEGEKALGYQLTALTAMQFLDYKITGNRNRYESVLFERRRVLSDLVIAEAIEGKGRFVEQIVNVVWAICEESYWGVPAHLSLQKAGTGLPDVNEPTVDLFAAQTASLLAWTDYLVGTRLDGVSPLIRQRILAEVDRRVLTPALTRSDFWWMGFDYEPGVYKRRVNNWNPWICSSWLSAVLLLEPDEDRRLRAVHKIMQTLDNFLNPHPADGGCDEGPGYWGHAGASLFDCLELLYLASQGKINLYTEPVIQNIGSYIYKAHISGNYFVNFADASPIVSPTPDLVHRFGTRTQDTHMQQFGAYLASTRKADHPYKDVAMDRRLAELFNHQNLQNTPPAQPLLREAWLPESQLLFARSEEGSSKGLFLAAKGGNNNESHNHNDVGNFIVYVNGLPALIDVGVNNYTAKTFSKDRYTIWTMQSAYHNLPSVNGHMQRAGREYEAQNLQYKSTSSYSELSMELAKAYPAEAGLTSWVRTLRLTRGRDISLQENFRLREPSSQLALHFMTDCQVTLKAPGHLTLVKQGATPEESFTLSLLFEPGQLRFRAETIPLDSEDDSRLRNLWGPQLTRIVLEAVRPASAGRWKILIRQ